MVAEAVTSYTASLLCLVSGQRWLAGCDFSPSVRVVSPWDQPGLLYMVTKGESYERTKVEATSTLKSKPGTAPCHFCHRVNTAGGSPLLSGGKVDPTSSEGD